MSVISQQQQPIINKEIQAQTMQTIDQQQFKNNSVEQNLDNPMKCLLKLEQNTKESDQSIEEESEDNIDDIEQESEEHNQVPQQNQSQNNTNSHTEQSGQKKKNSCDRNNFEKNGYKEGIRAYYRYVKAIVLKNKVYNEQNFEKFSNYIQGQMGISEENNQFLTQFAKDKHKFLSAAAFSKVYKSQPEKLQEIIKDTFQKYIDMGCLMDIINRKHHKESETSKQKVVEKLQKIFEAKNMEIFFNKSKASQLKQNNQNNNNNNQNNENNLNNSQIKNGNKNEKQENKEINLQENDQNQNQNNIMSQLPETLTNPVIVSNQDDEEEEEEEQKENEQNQEEQEDEDDEEPINYICNEDKSDLSSSNEENKNQQQQQLQQQKNIQKKDSIQIQNQEEEEEEDDLQIGGSDICLQSDNEDEEENQQNSNNNNINNNNNENQNQEQSLNIPNCENRNLHIIKQLKLQQSKNIVKQEDLGKSNLKLEEGQAKEQLEAFEQSCFEFEKQHETMMMFYRQQLGAFKELYMNQVREKKKLEQEIKNLENDYKQKMKILEEQNMPQEQKIILQYQVKFYFTQKLQNIYNNPVLQEHPYLKKLIQQQVQLQNFVISHKQQEWQQQQMMMQQLFFSQNQQMPSFMSSGGNMNTLPFLNSQQSSNSFTSMFPNFNNSNNNNNQFSSPDMSSFNNQSLSTKKGFIKSKK